MNSTSKIEIFNNFRENVLLLAVLYVIRPVHSTTDTTWLIMNFAIFGLLFIENIRPIVRNNALFLWEKIVFITTLCYEGCLMAVRPFVIMPLWVEWVTMGWLIAFVVLLCVSIYAFPAIEKKGKWALSISVKEACALAFSNYFCMGVSLLAIAHSIF